jgi:hypothetical protein
MTAIALRILIFVLIAGAVFLGARRIWRDWKGQFQAEDKAKLERDRAERDQMQRKDVMITLKRDKDGKFRPPEE